MTLVTESKVASLTHNSLSLAHTHTNKHINNDVNYFADGRISESRSDRKTLEKPGKQAGVCAVSSLGHVRNRIGG